jgi:protein-L-isoaspartate(D-aspartate) O-methyltransferase
MSERTPQTLVDELRASGDLTDSRVDAAFNHVARHLFLPGAPLESVYADKSVTVRVDDQGKAVVSSTMPSMVARLLSQCRLHEGQNVLQIGTGTGYIASLTRYIVGDDGTVTTLEIDRDVAEVARTSLSRAGYSAVNVTHVDGAQGYAPRASYDRIVANVGMWDIPLPWVRQLKPDGLIIAPIFLDGLQVTAAFDARDDGVLVASGVKPSAFVYARGVAAMPAVRQRIGSTALMLVADDLHRLDTASLHMLLSQDHDMTNRLSQPLNSGDYWYGFLPYITLNEPEKDVFALYTIEEGQVAYGMEGEGFALFTPASACFVPYYGIGTTHIFAGADAFLAVEDMATQWNAAGRPGLDRLNIHLIPKKNGVPVDVAGKIYPRRDHFLHAWFD